MVMNLSRKINENDELTLHRDATYQKIKKFFSYDEYHFWNNINKCTFGYKF